MFSRRFYQIASLLMLLVLLLPVQPVYAVSSEAPPVSNIPSVTWDELKQKQPEEKGVFNRALRQEIRAQLELIQLSDLEGNIPKQIQDKFQSRLEVLDKELQKYVRVGASKKHYSQLKRLMPALKNIEERKLITALYKHYKVRLPNLRNSRFMSFLDKRITRLANGMIFNMKPLVRERKSNEAELLAVMEQYGVAFSARPPDFILDYKLSNQGADAQSEWRYDAEISLLNQYYTPVVSVTESMTIQAQDSDQAEKKALGMMAEALTLQLKKLLVEQAQKS